MKPIWKLVLEDQVVAAQPELGQAREALKVADEALKKTPNDAAAKADAGEDVRMEASMVKLWGTEMATEIIDHAMQSFGAMGVAKELPLQLMAQKVRTMRVYEGPSEVHRMAIARRIMGR